MVFIKDQNAISEYRKRRACRLDGKNWVEELNLSTISDQVKPTIAEKPKEDVVDVRLSKDMKPSREYIFLRDGEILKPKEWMEANRRVLRPIYEESGLDGVDEEYYKGLLVNATRGLRKIPIREAFEKAEAGDKISSVDDSKSRRRLIWALLKDKERRNAALNIMYENYRDAVDGCKSFEDFLTTPISLRKVTSGDLFSSYLFGGDDLQIRPIDTFGSMRIGPDAAVMVPFWREEGRPVREEDVWDWRKKEKIVFEEKDEEPVEIDIIDAIKSEAEMIKLFSDDKTEVGRDVIDRCIDSIHRLIKRLIFRSEEVHTDSAFFSGELDDNLGERNVLYPEVDAFRERRQKRLEFNNR